MAQKVFERYEKKYMLSRQQYEALKGIISQYMEPDRFTNYTIQNINYDTDTFELIRRSIEKPKYKEKMRVRMYGNEVSDRSKLFLEIKKKFDHVVYKRREEMPYLQAKAYLEHGIYAGEKSQILKEISYTMHRYDLHPAVYIAYDREAFSGISDKELRLTFDHNIRCRTQDLDFKAGDYGTSLLEEDQILMEVKIPGAMPLWMARFFSENHIFMTSFSKYGTYYSRYLKDRICSRAHEYADDLYNIRKGA